MSSVDINGFVSLMGTQWTISRTDRVERMICEREKNHKDKRLNDRKWNKSRKKSIDAMIGTPIIHAKDPTPTIAAITNAVEGFFFPSYALK